MAKERDLVAVGYSRRSKESGERTVSLDAQAAGIADYCRAQGWQLAALVTDDGVSGGRRERFARLDATVRETRAQFVVVSHLDRLARDAAAMLDWLEKAGRRGVELHVVGRGKIETQTASGYLMAGVEGVVAAHYRKLVAEKTRDALARLRARGQRTSRFAPYGYRLLSGGRVAPDRGEQTTLAKITTLRASGLSLRRISRVLADQGVVARNGRPFAAKVLLGIVTNRSDGNSQVAS